MAKAKENFDNVNVEQTLSVPAGLENAESKDIIDYLFANDNRLLTATGAAMELSRDTQSLVAYFSGGEIIISRTHRLDIAPSISALRACS